MRSLKYIFFLLLFITNPLFSQGPKTDSLLQALSKTGKDTVRVSILNDLTKDFRNNNPDTAILMGKEALRISLDLRHMKGIAKSCQNIGVGYYLLGDFPEALRYFNFALPAWKLVYPPKGGSGYATTLGNMGLVYNELGNYPRALECFLHVLQVGEDLKEKQIILNTYNNVGLAYFSQKDMDHALEYYQKGLKADEEAMKSADPAIARTGKKGIAVLKNNIGNVFYSRGDLRQALAYYKESLIAREELKMKNLMASTNGNLGVVYSDLARREGTTPFQRDSLFKLSKIHLEKALELNEATGDENGISTDLINLSNLYLDQKRPAEALPYLQKGLKLSLDIGVKSNAKAAYYSLSRLDSLKNDHRSSFANYKLYIQYGDSLSNEENTKKTVQAEMQYEFDKKEAATKLEQEKKEAVAEAEKRRQRIVLFAISGFGLLILIFAIFAYRSFLQKRRANIEISHQKHLIEEKQKEILDSIYYARRIQRSLLTSEKYIHKHLCRLKDLG